MNEIAIEKDIIIISNKTLIKLFSYKNWSDLVSLYMFYHKQCKLQWTNQSFTLWDFVKKGLNWWDKRFKSAKKILKELYLIEDIQHKNDKWQIVWHFIKLNYIQSHNKANLSTGAENHPLAVSIGGSQETNAWSNITINAWNNIKEKAQSVKEKKQYIKNINLEEVKAYKNNFIIIYLSEMINSNYVKQSFTTKSFIELYDYIILKGKEYGFIDNVTGDFKAKEFKLELEKINNYYEIKEIKNFKSTFLNWISRSKR